MYPARAEFQVVGVKIIWRSYLADNRRGKLGLRIALTNPLECNLNGAGPRSRAETAVSRSAGGGQAPSYRR